MIQNQEPANLIIIAEDSLTQAERLRITLEKFGYEVAHVINGREALDLIRKRKPLMVLTDILMPEMDGYELCHCIKTDEKIWDIPVILLTSLSDTCDVIKGLECGADSYIMKPFQEQYLLSRINQVLINKHLLRREKPVKSLDIYFAGRNYKINSNPLQILNLLLSTYDSAVQRNLELAENEKELILMNLSLQQKVEERKKELQTQLIQKIEAEKILKKSEEKYRELVDNSLAGVFISDIRGNILFSNDALASMLNYHSAENLLAVNIRKLFKIPDDLDILTEKLKKEGKVSEFTAEFLLKTGETKHVIISSSLEDEKLSGIILDNTDRVLAAERISKYQKELIQSKERAEQSEKLKTAFLTNMSNEILTPMNSLIGFAELLSNPGLSIQKLTEYTNQITESGNYLINLIDNIIDIAKIESGEVRINLSECKINQMLLELYGIYDRKIREKEKDQEKIHLYLRRDNKDKDFAIISEPYRLKQILDNLLSNALKFTESGSIEFGYRIINKSDEAEGNSIQFYVKDTGKGIPEEKLSMIFDRFRQSKESYTKLSDGAGLGLPVSKAYIELLGGRISIKSEMDSGTEFYFVLPYEPVKGGEQIEVIAETSDTLMNWENKKILIAEDVEISWRYLEAILKRTKAQLIWAENGKVAIEKLSQNKDVDLILMDLRMPVMSGYDAIIEIKKMNKDIPIIVQTAFAREEDREKIRETGCDDFIVKPVRKEALINLMAHYFSK